MLHLYYSDNQNIKDISQVIEKAAYRLKLFDPPRFIGKYDLSKDENMASRFPEKRSYLVYFDESAALFYEGEWTDD